MNKKTKVLFVGSFLNLDKSGGVGGQMYACHTLLSSELSETFEWLKVDTTAPNNLKISVIRKTPRVLKRIFRFLWLLHFSRPEFVLIFTSNGLSFLEKGIMTVLAKKLSNAVVILAPRSGRLKAELATTYLKFGKIVFNNSDVLLCQGESWSAFYRKLYPDLNSKLVIQQNWIDCRFYPIAKPSGHKLKILFMAWLERDKGIFQLLEAIENLNQDSLNKIELHIAGKGKDEDLVSRIVSEKKWANQVFLHGWVVKEEKAKLLEQTDIFILPSFFEGMPNTLLECMCSGIACIATNVGAVGDVIENRKNGILISPGNVAELKDALNTLINDVDLRSYVSMNAREYILREHSITEAVTTFKEQIFIK